MSFRIRNPIKLQPGRPIRALLYARYSTEEQDETSIEDQFSYCRRFLEDNGIANAQIEYQSDEQTSGELASRPGIDMVKNGIEVRRWDLLVVEDTGRLFRHVTACGQLIEAAVDNDIRVIAINDYIDTAEEDWHDRLMQASQHHARSNQYTSMRIKRKLTGLFVSGAAVGHVRPGYRRRASAPATPTEPARGPHFDEIDPKWAPVVREAFERIAQQHRPWEVADWLTSIGLPKRNNGSKAWTDGTVLALIHCPIYRGVEEYRKQIVKKVLRSGKHKLVPNDPNQVCMREMPHLRIVTDELWHKANRAIEGRRLHNNFQRAEAHPLRGIPRDSRGPLSGILMCGICGAKMICTGRNEGGYKCSNARYRKCWNRASPMQSVVHANLAKAITDGLLSLDGKLEEVLNMAKQIIQNETSQESIRKKLQSEKQTLETKNDRLAQAVALSDQPITILVQELTNIQKELLRVTNEISSLNALHEAVQIPTMEELKAALAEEAKRILSMDRTVRSSLQHLVGKIRVVPYQQFGTLNAVMRAHFELKLAAILPGKLALALTSQHTKEFEERIIRIPMVVDLFNLSRGPAFFWKQAIELHNAGMGLDAVALKLGTNRGTAARSINYGKKLVAAGLDDPFVLLTEAPARISHWRFTRRKSADAPSE